MYIIDVTTEVTMVRNVDSSSELIHNASVCIWYKWINQYFFLMYDNKILGPKRGIFSF